MACKLLFLKDLNLIKLCYRAQHAKGIWSSFKGKKIRDDEVTQAPKSIDQKKELRY